MAFAPIQINGLRTSSVSVGRPEYLRDGTVNRAAHKLLRGAGLELCHAEVQEGKSHACEGVGEHLGGWVAGRQHQTSHFARGCIREGGRGDELEG